MATSLAAKSVGAPDNSFNWYLHTGGIALATGFAVATGNGTETALWLDSAGIGVRNPGGFVSKISTLAGSTRNVELANASGKLFPALTATLAAEASNSTTTPAAVSGFEVPLEASGQYEFELVLLVKSSVAATAPRFAIQGPTAQTTWVSYYADNASGYASAFAAEAWGTAYSNTATGPTANTPYFIIIRGACKMAASAPAVPVSLQLYAEAAAATVYLMAGSTMKFHKTN